MKELTIEQKAKAYDEVREKIAIRFSSNVADEIFSEYEESKDERIKKYIIKYFGASKDELSEGFKWNGITVEECIAWLEKQGDKDKLIQELGEYKVKYTQEVLEKHLKTINKDDERLRKTTIAFLKDFAEQGYENAIECIDWLEEQGEQKPADTEKGAKGNNREIPNSSWSEEDDMIRNNIIEYINSSDIDKMAQDSWISWLKNIPIKERKGCINYDYVNKCCAAGGKPQSQWKPSERDLGSLTDAIIHYKGIGIRPNGLTELLEQLKKLKEE